MRRVSLYNRVPSVFSASNKLLLVVCCSEWIFEIDKVGNRKWLPMEERKWARENGCPWDKLLVRQQRMDSLKY